MEIGSKAPKTHKTCHKVNMLGRFRYLKPDVKEKKSNKTSASSFGRSQTT